MQIKRIKKLYYSIGDVSEMTDLKQYVLRYWETEFPMLKPAKNRAGNRTYKNEDIKVIRQIKELLYEKKFTIQGAKQYLTELYDKNNEDTNIVNISSHNVDKEFLQELKSKLEDTIELLEKFKD